MKSVIKKTLPLSDQGIRNLRIGICTSIFRDVCVFLPFVIIYRLIQLILQPFTGDAPPTRAELWRLFIIGVAIALLYLFSVWLSDERNNIFTYREMDRMRRSAAARLIQMPMSFLNSVSRSDLVNHLMADCAACEVAISGLIPSLIAHLTSSIVILVVLAVVNWKLALAAFAVIPVSYMIQALSLRTQASLTKRQLKAKRCAENTMLEYIAGMPVIKAYHLSGAQFDRLTRDLNAVRHISTKLELTAGIFVSGAEVVLQLGIGIVILAGTWLLNRGEVSLSILLLFWAVILRFYEPIAASLGELSNLIYMRESLKRLSDLLSSPVRTTERITPTDYSVEFSNVYFYYCPDLRESAVLHDISFFVPAGSFTALVGPSGSGKTTVLRLAANLWSPTDGAVKIGGITITSNIDLSNVVAYVEQDPVLFHDSILNNILMGNPNATREEAISAARAAQCHFVETRLPNGFDTVIAENGASLSGGERQRIAIARAILKNAPILLLDEPTASLDAENEILVQNAISGLLKQGKTVLMIAHRLKTVENADQILVMENGKITQVGTHAKLIAQDGVYRKLYELQESAQQWNVKEAN